MQQVVAYKDDLSQITIGTRTVELTTLNEVIYTGQFTVSVAETETVYAVNLDASTMLLTLTASTTAQCTLMSDGDITFEHLYELANHKIFKSIYGSDWSYAMSLCIAHYLTLIANQLQAPAGNTLEGIAGGGVTKGVLSSASIGGFSKSYDINKTMSEEEEALFWNQTSYGAALWALLKTKPIPTIMVVTSGPVPGAN